MSVEYRQKLNFCSPRCKLQYYQGMTSMVRKSLKTLSFIGEQFQVPAQTHSNNKTGNSSKVVLIKSKKVETQIIRRLEPDPRLFSSENSSSSSPKSSSTVKFIPCSPNELFSTNKYFDSSFSHSTQFLTLLNNYSPTNKDVFYGTFKICHQIDSSPDFHKFIQKTGSQQKCHAAQSNARAGQLNDYFSSTLCGVHVISYPPGTRGTK